jgi:murein L,D-transpeptidase YafK
MLIGPEIGPGRVSVTALGRFFSILVRRHTPPSLREREGMNALRTGLLTLLLTLPFAPTSSASSSASSMGAGIDEIRIDKSDHTLELREGGRSRKTYRVAIGPGGAGPKRMEGDQVRPVGTYKVTGRIKGLFHQFLVVSYPNDEDRRRFSELKKSGQISPERRIGDGIGIHGTGRKEWTGVHKETDWTLGCVALDDAEIDEVAGLVKDGTRIVITD